ncbi:hypothetical protein MTR67_018773 [Solanum verrucosum]|uniref:Uncharacterized protein n=1 Tax=Solanum verrucosum TaxID=315347 RepID=A0AAF0TU24_SOLVR|nr:hypothetical protein MTR67_018773 [Solanum verrucosum]
MGSVSHVEEERKELAKDVHRLAPLGVRLMSISDGGVTVQNGAETSLVVEVKEMQDSDPILLEHKGAVHNQRVEVRGSRQKTSPEIILKIWLSVDPRPDLRSVQVLSIQITLRSVPDLQFSRTSGESSFSEDNSHEFLFSIFSL